MQIVEERLLALKEVEAFNYSIEIEDLYMDQQETGTKVYITISIQD